MTSMMLLLKYGNTVRNSKETFKYYAILTYRSTLSRHMYYFSASNDNKAIKATGYRMEHIRDSGYYKEAGLVHYQIECKREFNDSINWGSRIKPQW